MLNSNDRMPLYCPGRRRGGSVLIGALIFTLIIAVLLSGTVWTVSSHYARATTDGDYTHALYMAEAGINFEIKQMSVNASSADEKYGVGGVLLPLMTYNASNLPVPLPLTGQFQVSVRADNIYDPIDTTPDSIPWVVSNAVIESTGTANPNTSYAVSRTVRVRAQGHSIFEDYTFFAINSATTSGSTGAVVGTCGTDCAYTISGNPTIIGPLTFNGYPNGTYNGGTVTGGIFHQPNLVVWPTVSQIADAAMSIRSGTLMSPAGAGLTYLKTHNDNALIQIFASGDASHVTTPPSALTTSAGATTTSYNLLSLFPSTFDTNPGDNVGGNRYAIPQTTFTYANPPNYTITWPAYGIYNKQVVILPSAAGVTRDYYFETVVMSGAQALVVDNSKGPIRIWLGGSGGVSLAASTMLFTSTDPSQFRLYDAQSSGIAMSGTAMIPGGIYVYNGGATGTLAMSGGTNVRGSVICGNWTGSGSATIVTPSTPIGNPSDWARWYGFGAEFDETSPLAH